MTPTETPLEIRKDSKIGVEYKSNTLIIIQSDYASNDFFTINIVRKPLFKYPYEC